MTLSEGSRIGLAGAAVVGVAFGMARYACGLALPGIREELGLSELVLGLVSSATFAGYLAGLLLAGRLAVRHGSRAPTTVGGACGAAGAVLVTFAQAPWRLVWAGIALAAVLAVWTAELVPDRAGAAFTACLVVGAVSSVAAPAIAGAVIPGLGLGVLLVLTAAVSLSSGVALWLYRSTRGATVGGTGP